MTAAAVTAPVLRFAGRDWGCRAGTVEELLPAKLRRRVCRLGRRWTGSPAQRRASSKAYLDMLAALVVDYWELLQVTAAEGRFSELLDVVPELIATYERRGAGDDHPG